MRSGHFRARPARVLNLLNRVMNGRHTSLDIQNLSSPSSPGSPSSPSSTRPISPKMLATSSFRPSSPNPSFLPAIPSPLSPRSTNIHGRRVGATPIFFPTMSHDPENAQEPLHSNPKSASTTSPRTTLQPFSKRAVKKAPSPKQDELKEKRRSNFLRKVQESREDKRFESRGEDIMRRDYLRRRRLWEEQLAAEVQGTGFGFVGEEEEEDGTLPEGDGMVFPTQGSEPAMGMMEEEADEVALREREEVEALLEYMPGDGRDGGVGGAGGGGAGDGQDGSQANLWSDDDDYDALFSELMEKEGGAAGAVSQRQVEGADDAMDLS